MKRNHNTDINGLAWTEQIKKSVWQKGLPIDGYDQTIWRRDKCGRVMKYSEHGNRQNDYGWEIDHINPVLNGGDDKINNLQPLNWSNNANKADKLNWICPR